uniref:Uncharacterized protein n=1 Tax=Triticum urartu TaxID=4572 RepID=A0A8R7TPC2_TRIUA
KNTIVSTIHPRSCNDSEDLRPNLATKTGEVCHKVSVEVVTRVITRLQLQGRASSSEWQLAIVGYVVWCK